MSAPLHLLLTFTADVSAALLLVLALRPLLRRLFGSAAVYAAWLIVPVTVVAILLPRPAATNEIATLIQIAPQANAIAAATAQLADSYVPAADRSADIDDLCLVLWLAGALGTVAMLAVRQRRFLRSLGVLTPARENIYYAANSVSGPVLLGVVLPKIVLPADFALRYTAEEQSLILAHERIHWHRGDMLANALCAALRVVLWFHPLLPFAAARFSFDQELACDSEVLRRHPHARRTYADAMLKTQLAGATWPLGCTWQSHHPLKERVMHMKTSSPRQLRRTAGQVCAAILTLSTAYAAWAAGTQAPGAPAQAAAPVAATVADMSAAAPSAMQEATPLASMQAPAKPEAAASVTPSAATAKGLDTKVWVNMKEVSAQSLYAALAAGSGYEIELAADIPGPISANFQNMTLGAVLSALRDANGYDYTIDGRRILIRATSKAAMLAMESAAVAPTGSYVASIDYIIADGEKKNVLVALVPGQPLTLKTESKRYNATCETALLFDPLKDETYKIKATITCGGKFVSEPRIISVFNEFAAISIGKSAPTPGSEGSFAVVADDQRVYIKLKVAHLRS